MNVNTNISESSGVTPEERYFIERLNSGKIVAYVLVGQVLYKVTAKGRKLVPSKVADKIIKSATEVTEQVMQNRLLWKKGWAFAEKLLAHGLIDHAEVTERKTLTLENISVKGELKESWIQETASATIALAGSNEDYADFKFA